jgi:hypothetical protein
MAPTGLSNCLPVSVCFSLSFFLGGGRESSSLNFHSSLSLSLFYVHLDAIPINAKQIISQTLRPSRLQPLGENKGRTLSNSN